jgi:hypothetical protein
MRHMEKVAASYWLRTCGWSKKTGTCKSDLPFVSRTSYFFQEAVTMKMMDTRTSKYSGEQITGFLRRAEAH